MNIEGTVRLFGLMLQGTYSRVDLAQQLGVNPKAVGRVLNEMKAQKLIYVIDYTNETDGRNRVKKYALGDGVDAKPKQTQSQEDRSRRSYVKKVAAQKQANIKTTFAAGARLWA